MSNTVKEGNSLSGILNISKLPLNQTQFYKLDKKQDWVRELLIELNEKAQDKSAKEYLDETTLEIELNLTKCFKPEYGEYLLIKGEISTSYVTACVRTLEDMCVSLDIGFKSCFLDKKFEEDEAFSEQLEIFEKNELYDLYFYEKGLPNLAEMTHEVIYLNINQYPIKDPDAPLLDGNDENSTKH